MARIPCSVCTHSGREHIDAELKNGIAVRPIAAKYGLSKTSIERHRANHMGLAKRGTPFRAAVHSMVSTAIGASLAASETVAEIHALRNRADTLCKHAEVSNDPRTALMAIRELTRLLELQGRLTLEAQSGRASDISAHPVWQRLNSELMGVLAKHPAAEEEWKVVLGRILGVTPDPGGTL